MALTQVSTDVLNNSQGNITQVGTLTSLSVGGNTTIGGDLTVQGNLFINGNATVINANNLVVNDSMIFMADFNPADTLDIGFVSSYTDLVRYQHTGFVRDATDNTWKLFANVIPEPTTTVDFGNASYSNLRIGNLTSVGGAFTGNLSAPYLIGQLGTAAQPAITQVGTLSALSVTGNVTVSANVKFTGWQIYEQGTTLFFAYNGVNRMSLNTSGNLTVSGDIAGFGTP